MPKTMAKPKKALYSEFSKIDGSHPLKEAVLGAYVDYRARVRPDGSILYFNFPLAKEMGLIPNSHPENLNPNLKKAILDTFSLQIVNEYDLMKEVEIPKKDLKEGHYMATRYLQLQHPSRTGMTSGDGRGIWNGAFESKNGVWDIASSGTGATCFSPATAIEGRFFRTGNKSVSYGGGRTDLIDIVCAGVMSGIFYKNEISTERVLAIISYPDGTGIHVRVGKNLIRPAHMFLHLKQNNLDRLKNMVDYYIDRQVANGEWKKVKDERSKYEYFLANIAVAFAEVSARFELDYIFCWLDWDGDNILCDGGIIDYGSIRRFGLYHQEYRYDDVNQMSTTIGEQKQKAKYIVQTFAQLADYLITGKKKNLHQFRKHKILKVFDKQFKIAKQQQLLYKIGFNEHIINLIMNSVSGLELLDKFGSYYYYFERVKAKRGLYKVSDGITQDAIFSIRDIMKEIPKLCLEKELPLKPRQFIDIIKTDYASQNDLKITDSRKRKIMAFQKTYQQLIEKAASLNKTSKEEILLEIEDRSQIINRYERLTGDGIIRIAEKLIRASREVSFEVLHQMIFHFIDSQIYHPDAASTVGKRELKHARAERIYELMQKAVFEYSEGI